MPTARISTRLGKRSATTFDVHLHVKAQERMSVNATASFNTTVIKPLILQKLDLHNTAVLEILSAIEGDVVNSVIFQRKFDGYIHFNSSVGMRCWKRSDRCKRMIKKSESFDVRTEADTDDDKEREEIKTEWVKHVLEHGEEIEEQHFAVDIGIVVCKNGFPEKSRSRVGLQNVTNILVDKNDGDMSSITSLTRSSKKRQKEKKKEVFVAPQKLHVYVMHPVVFDDVKGSYETPHTTVLSDFVMDFDREEFVEFRLSEDFGSAECDEEALLLDGIEQLLEQNSFNEDKLKSNILQPLKNKLGNHIVLF